MTLAGASAIQRALQLVGELLAFERTRVGIVIVGGAALNLLGILQRATTDVDVLAFATSLQRDGHRTLEAPPAELPEALSRAVEDVAASLGLSAGWMNTAVGEQWKTGLPPGLAERVTWMHFGPPDEPTVGLDVGIAARPDLVFLKLFAAIDLGAKSVHYRDLLMLDPSDEELTRAAAWVLGQDAGPEFPRAVEAMLSNVKRDLAREREKNNAPAH